MKKRLFAIMLIAFLAWGLWPIENSEAISNQEPDQIIRLHIRAQDDSKEAQEKKLIVRDKVNELLGSRLLECNNIDEAHRVMEESLADIKEIAEQSSGQSATVRLDKEYFPDRVYGGEVYPAGEYEALIIELNGGEGKNWWCVAFPPLCYRSVDNTDYLAKDTQPKVVYNSRIVEFFNWIRSLF